jgi:CheY-like chemotaxis protein
MATILLAEDDKDVADLLADILQDYTTVRVGDGKAAVQKARELKPDLVLMDKNMPVMNGIEACRIIKSDPELKSIPVIMLTGEGQMSTVETAIELGADDYVQKPFTPKRLIQHIELVLAKARKA